jgi:hypothetical protein
MRNLYEKVGVNETPVHHLSILAALKSGNESELRLMVRTDVTKGLRMLTR